MQESHFDQEAQLVSLRSIFRMTGVLHEVHVFNLKHWPAGLFDSAKVTSIKVDSKAPSVKFELEVKNNWIGKPKIPKDWELRCACLDNSVKAMLGPEVEVEVIINTKTIFLGRRTAEFKSPEYEGTDFEAGRVVPETPWTFPKN
jgi:hypothetical protein